MAAWGTRAKSRSGWTRKEVNPERRELEKVDFCFQSFSFFHQCSPACNKCVALDFNQLVTFSWIWMSQCMQLTDLPRFQQFWVMVSRRLKIPSSTSTSHYDENHNQIQTRVFDLQGMKTLLLHVSLSYSRSYWLSSSSLVVEMWQRANLPS